MGNFCFPAVIFIDMNPTMQEPWAFFFLQGQIEAHMYNRIIEKDDRHKAVIEKGLGT